MSASGRSGVMAAVWTEVRNRSRAASSYGNRSRVRFQEAHGQGSSLSSNMVDRLPSEDSVPHGAENVFTNCCVYCPSGSHPRQKLLYSVKTKLGTGLRVLSCVFFLLISAHR